jgi:hypothetical protein
MAAMKIASRAGLFVLFLSFVTLLGTRAVLAGGSSCGSDRDCGGGSCRSQLPLGQMRHRPRLLLRQRSRLWRCQLPSGALAHLPLRQRPRLRRRFVPERQLRRRGGLVRER